MGVCGRVKVRLSEDRMGNVIGYPIREDLRKKIKDHLFFYGVDSDGTFLVQEDYNIESLLGEIPKRAGRDLRKGWDIVVLMDPWQLGHYYGWDTQTIFE